MAGNALPCCLILSVSNVILSAISRSISLEMKIMGEIAYTSTEIDEFKQLLGKKLPAYRKAYSDRTAWLMACMSELAYRKFNKAMNSSFEKKIAELISSEKVSSLVLAYINKHIYDHEEEKRILQEELGTFSLRLATTFSVDGTEAILVHSQSEDFLILAFRGTEADSFTDIRTDLNAHKHIKYVSLVGVPMLAFWKRMTRLRLQ